MTPNIRIRGVAIAGFLAVAAAACADEDTKPPPPGGSLAELASTVNDASQALLDSVLDREVEPRWRFPKSARSDLKRAGRELSRLGGVERLATVVELGAVRADGNPSQIVATAVVFPNGQVAWTAVGARGGSVEPDAVTVESAAPGVASGVRAMIAMMASQDCESLRLVQPDDVAEFPPAARKLFRDPSAQLPRLCKLMNGQSDGWTARVDNLTVVVANGDSVGVLRSGIDITGVKAALRTPRFQKM